MPKTAVLGPDPAIGRALGAFRGAPATVVFLGCCVALFVVAEQYGSTEDTWTLVRFGALERGRIWQGEVWRLVTAAFLHIGVVHLAWNVLGMLGWCVPVERAMGTLRFVVLYLGAAIAASGTSVLAHDVVGAGASGAGFGVVGATLTLDFRRLGSWRAFVADRHVRSIGVGVAVWTVALAAMNVDHAAHFGGLAAGGVLTWALTLPAGASTRSRRRAAALALAVIAAPATLAAIPRAGLSLHAERTLLKDLESAFERDDLAAAEELLAGAQRAGYRSPRTDYVRAFVLEGRGELDAAARGYDALARSADPLGQHLGTRAGKMLLARRLTYGLGMAPDEERALTLLREICASDAEAVERGEDEELAPFCRDLPRPVPAKAAPPEARP